MPEIPKDAKKPSDHKAAKAEATDPDAPIPFEWRGQFYEIDPSFRDDIEILEDLEEKHYVKCLRHILGDAQWSEFKDANREANGRVKATLAEEFAEELFEAVGAGN